MERDMSIMRHRQSGDNNPGLIGKNGRLIIMVACVLIAVGYLLMAGPGSTEQHFREEIFSARRIVAAPMCCLAGYLLIIVGILRKG